ncbi:unnamed protein product, partial [Iphiclides podalirius]
MNHGSLVDPREKALLTKRERRRCTGAFVPEQTRTHAVELHSSRRRNVFSVPSNRLSYDTTYLPNQQLLSPVVCFRYVMDVKCGWVRLVAAGSVAHTSRLRVGNTNWKAHSTRRLAPLATHYRTTLRRARICTRPSLARQRAAPARSTPLFPLSQMHSSRARESIGRVRVCRDSFPLLVGGALKFRMAIFFDAPMMTGL